MERKILHIDMDAFFASVEIRDNPSLRGRPVIVGGSPEGRGVVAAASYEARRFGVHSAMAAARARRLCPEAVFLRPRFERYRADSERIRGIFARYADRVEPLSLDEAYLDVTDCPTLGGDARAIAQRIKEEIRAETALVASAGVSYNKFLAKQASDADKPDGLYVITREQGPRYVATLEVAKFHGVGPATAERMQRLGIRTGGDLITWPLEALLRHFGKRGEFFYEIARGRDDRPVDPARVRKSIGSETTFEQDLREPAAMLAALAPLAEDVCRGLETRGLDASTVTLKVKYRDFRQVTRSCSRPGLWESPEATEAVLAELLGRTEASRCPVRLLGVSASGLTPRKSVAQQLSFDWSEGALPQGPRESLAAGQ